MVNPNPQVIYTYEYTTNNTLLFPDVTICNVNPFLKSKFCDQSGPAWTDQDISTNIGFIDPEADSGSGWIPFCRDNAALCASP